MANKKYVLDDLVEKEINKMVSENSETGYDLKDIDLNDPESIQKAMDAKSEKNSKHRKIYTNKDIEDLEKEISEFKDNLTKSGNVTDAMLKKLKSELKTLEAVKESVEYQRKLTCVYVGIVAIAESINRKDFDKMSDEEFGDAVELILKTIRSSNNRTSKPKIEDIDVDVDKDSSNSIAGDISRLFESIFSNF